MPTVTIQTFTQTDATGTYDPATATLTATVIRVSDGKVVATGTRDNGVMHPNWRFTFTGIPSKVLVRLVVVCTDGDLSLSDTQEAIF